MGGETDECAVVPSDSDEDDETNWVTGSDEIPNAAAGSGDTENLSDEVSIVKTRRRGHEGRTGHRSKARKIETSSKLKHILIGTAVGTGAVLAAPLVLSAVGFTSAGVAAGSIAAAIQTPMTVAGGWFASCQSAGVLGMAVSTKLGIGAAAGGAAGVSSNVWSLLSKKKK